MNYQHLIMSMILCLLLAGSGNAQNENQGNAFDRDVDDLLKQVVTREGLVRYELLVDQPGELVRLSKGLEKERAFDTRQEKMAFYINAYNLLTLKQVIDHWPVKSVMDIKGFFDKNKYIVNGQAITLNDIENNIIRPMGDARIHSALVCAAISCPPLRNEAYTAKKIGKQLSENTRLWLADEHKNTADEKKLLVSKIFQWYGEDFNNQETISLVSFLRSYSDEDSKVGKFLAEHQRGGFEIMYMQYDWQLNAAVEPDITSEQ